MPVHGCTRLAGLLLTALAGAALIGCAGQPSGPPPPPAATPVPISTRALGIHILPNSTATAAAGVGTTTSSRGVSTPAATTSNARAAPAAAGVTPAQPDPALQRTLNGAVLSEPDLPSGFKSVSGISPVTRPGDAADVVANFAKTAQAGGPAGVQSLLVTMTGFADQRSAGAAFNDSKDQAVARATSAGGKAEPISSPSLGDQAAAFHMTASNGGVSSDGYIIVWRRGRVGVLLSSVGTSEPPSLDSVIALAQQQDARLQAAGV